MNSTYGKLNRENKATFCYVVSENNRMKPWYLSQIITIALPGLVVMPRLALRLVFQKRFQTEKDRKPQRRANTLDPYLVFGAKSGSKAFQMAPKMEPISGKKQSKNWLMNGYRFVALRDAVFSFFDNKTDLKGENNCSQFCTTWKRLNVPKATKSKGF